MLVVADSSPLNVLIRIDCVEVLPELFETVTIPSQVAAELTHARTPQAVKDFITAPPPWLEIRRPLRIDPIPNLDRGEEAAINLAIELKAALLLIDDLDGRKAAIARQVAVIGTIGVLQRAAERGNLDIQVAFKRQRQTDFRVVDDLLNQALGNLK